MILQGQFAEMVSCNQCVDRFEPHHLDGKSVVRVHQIIQLPVEPSVILHYRVVYSSNRYFLVKLSLIVILDSEPSQLSVYHVERLATSFDTFPVDLIKVHDDEADQAFWRGRVFL